MDRDEQAKVMADQHAEGWSIERIAAEHDVSVATVRRRLGGKGRYRDQRRPKSPPSPGTDISFESDTAAMWADWVGGMRQWEIAEKHGITQQTVSERLTRYRQNLPETERETILRRELDLLDEMRAKLLAIVDSPSPPLFSNGRAVKDAEGDLVPDHGPQMQAIDRVLRNQERLAKYMGLDAPARAEVLHVEQATEAAKAEADAAVAFLNGGGGTDP